MTIDPELARRIRLVGFDVDGVLTDGGVYLGAVDGESASDASRRFELKRYDIQDGIGMEFLNIAGIRMAIVTGRVSESVRHRAKELRIEDVAQDPQAMKLVGLQKILDQRKIEWSEVAFVGDDFPDMPIMRKAGLPVAVGNAVPEVKTVAKVQLERAGGRGAVREFAELLLKARGEWDRAWNTYVDKRSGAGAPT
ncbi:MAG TPA: HAD hydrolase family protein [Gemmatimonadaceae bacterium]|nr:HAD hydrolase family protein [Gemmatimonadaceae bacterium]